MASSRNLVSTIGTQAVPKRETEPGVRKVERSKFSWRRENSLTKSRSLKMDSCLVLTECFSRQFYVLDLIHSERVSTSTSSVFAHRLAYSSQASMIMPKFWCREYERSSSANPVRFWKHGSCLIK